MHFKKCLRLSIFSNTNVEGTIFKKCDKTHDSHYCHIFVLNLARPVQPEVMIKWKSLVFILQTDPSSSLSDSDAK